MKKNIFFIISGLLVVSFAIPFLLHSNIGLDPYGCFLQSTSYAVSLSYPTMLSICNLLFLVFHFIKKRNIRFFVVGFLMSITMSLIINAFNSCIYLIPNDLIYQKALLFTFSFILLCTGVALIQLGRVQKLPFEGMQEVVSEMVNKDINVVRVYAEIVLFTLSIPIFIIVKVFINTEINIFHSINIGTVILMLFTGPTVNFVFQKIKHIGGFKNE